MIWYVDGTCIADELLLFRDPHKGFINLSLILLAQVISHLADDTVHFADIIARIQTDICDIFKGNIGDLVGIDPYEVSNRLSTLLAQIETSYTLTARIRQLSLVKFLP